MTNTGIPSIPASDLNPFLFANVGTQANGVELTVLSLLARLGSDPWAEAARLARLPRAAATDWLAERIDTTPLSTHSVNAARDTATTLLRLLPVRISVDKVVARAKDKSDRTVMWVLGAMVAAGVLGIIGANLHNQPPASAKQTTQGER